MKDARYRPPAGAARRIAPTENDPWRGRVVRGEVHDENAFALGGVAPARGPLRDRARPRAPRADAPRRRRRSTGRRIVSRATVELFTERAGRPGLLARPRLGHAHRRVGPAQLDAGAAGLLVGGLALLARSFGHTGFTGTSLWMDPERELYVILLTNRVHPTRENNAIRDMRAQVADAVVRALDRP